MYQCAVQDFVRRTFATGQNLAQPPTSVVASHNVTMPISARVQGHEKGMLEILFLHCKLMSIRF